MKAVSVRVAGAMMLRVSLVLFCVAWLGACSHPEGPSGDDIGKALSMRLPTGVQIDDVAVKVSENEGNKVEPEYQSRSDIKLKFTENFYAVQGHLDGKSVVKKTFSEGDTISGTVITRAAPRGDDDWNISFQRMDIPQITGMAESRFQPDSFVLVDSDAYKDLQDKVAAAQKKAQELAAQKAAAEVAATNARIADLKKQVVGTWAAKFPMLHNNSVWASRNNRKLGMQIRFDNTGGNIGQGEGILYDFDTPAHEVIVPIGYVVDPSGKFLTLNFTRTVQAPGVDFHTGAGDTWRFTPDGKLFNSGYNGTWLVQMERNGAALKQRLAQVKKYNAYMDAEHKLAAQYRAANADGRFYNLPLHDNTYGNFFVVGQANAGTVYGDGVYDGNSTVAAAVVHAGVLHHNQAGIVKITRIEKQRCCFNFSSTTRNGVTSQQSGRTGRGYTVSLVKALPVWKP